VILRAYTTLGRQPAQKVFQVLALVGHDAFAGGVYHYLTTGENLHHLPAKFWRTWFQCHVISLHKEKRGNPAMGSPRGRHSWL
jgi:hypothetical protein